MAKKNLMKRMIALDDLKKNPLSNLLPEKGKVLFTGSGKEFVERIGIETIRNVVHSVLIGENLRTRTEPLSRRRLAQVSGALIVMLSNGYSQIDDFQSKVSLLAADQLRNLKVASVNDSLSVWPPQWLLGLTGKSVQNVLRGSHEPLDAYVEEFENALNWRK